MYSKTKLKMEFNFKENLRDLLESASERGKIEEENIEFAKNFNKWVVQLTQKFYNTNLWEKYPAFSSFSYVLALTITDITAFLVLVFCLYFRLSVSMFFFLVVYMGYYYQLFDQIGKFLEEK